MRFSHPTIGATVPGTPQQGEITLTCVLGSGGFGVVYEGKCQDGSTVAVKFLHSAALADQHEELALANEVTAAQEIRHEHVLRLLAANLSSQDYPPYVISDYADGGRLEDRLQAAMKAKAAIPLDLVYAWCNDITDAMEAVNQRLLHRDLKPDNILFVGETLKVADFGLSKLVGAATRVVTFKGGQHVFYMAPEAWGGGKNEIQIDMYAAGIVMFQIATLQFPMALPPSGADLDAFR